MHVTRATIRNIRIIDDFEFLLDAKTPSAGWHVFLGDNGSGKSTVVRSIVLALVGAENAAASRQGWSGWLRENVSAGSIAVSLRQHLDHDRWSGNGRTSETVLPLKVNLTKNEVTGLVETSFQKGSSGPRTVWGSGKGWFSAAFGPFRRFRGGDREYDLPLNCHPVGTRARLVDTPSGAGGATDIRAELSDRAARLSAAVNRRSANALGVS